MVLAINKEIVLRNSFLKTNRLESIYFGGGTPSLLSAEQIFSIISQLKVFFEISDNAEITIETNPEDISIQYLDQIAETGINRLSLGVQSFDNDHLKLMNRAHDATQSLEAIQIIKRSSFKNFTVDFIYGIPASNHATWARDLHLLTKLDIPHVSAYNLTIEENTVFGNWQKNGKFIPASEDYEIEQYQMLESCLSQAGYLQYEISNFCKPGFKSRHNSNYWNQKPYLGIGPGAHSYDGHVRFANVRNNHRYIKMISDGIEAGEVEILDYNNKINEWILTKLRTYDGLDSKILKLTLGYDLNQNKSSELANMTDRGLIEVSQDVITLTSRGRLLADWIASELFLD